MKKIAFFVQHMICGGVENALVALASKLVQENDVDITIYMMEQTGEFLDKVPESIRLQEIEMPRSVRTVLPVGGIKLALKKKLQQKDYCAAMNMVCNKVRYRTGFSELDIAFDRIPAIAAHYDIAVNYHMHSPFLVRYLDEKVSATTKYTWIHNDFTTTGYNICALDKHLKCNDAFFAVAERLRAEFVDCLPAYEAQAKVAYNLVPHESIKQKADVFFPSEFQARSNDTLKLLSVGRLEHQKGYDITLQVAKRLKADGLVFCWYILGNGSLRSQLEKEIVRLGLSTEVFLLGVRENPYPYFKHCDLYVQTSRHEGYVTTVSEAKLLACPIVCTDVSGAKEQLEDGVNGYVTSFLAEDIYKTVKHLMQNKSERLRIIANLKEQEISQEDDCSMFIQTEMVR